MNPVEAAQAKPWYRIYFNPITSMFWAVHVAAIVGLIILGFSWAGLAWCLGSYFVRIFFVTGIFHRYFSHRTYKTSRVMQFILGLCTTTTVQKGPLWWAHHHRHHHRRSDMADDLHSPYHGGFWWSHIGWFLTLDFEPTDYSKIKDFAKYPEMVWLNRWWLIFVVAFATSLFFIGGWTALVWGFFASTVLCWHGTFTINSLSHLWGKRHYETSDDSRNNWVLALITNGEGWHNNHHHYQSSCRQGFRWYEIDVSYYIIRVMAFFRLVWDVREPPRYIVENRPKFVTEEKGRPSAVDDDAEVRVEGSAKDVNDAAEPVVAAGSGPVVAPSIPAVSAAGEIAKTGDEDGANQTDAALTTPQPGSDNDARPQL